MRPASKVPSPQRGEGKACPEQSEGVRSMRKIAVICRIKSTGKLLLITTYALEEK